MEHFRNLLVAIYVPSSVLIIIANLAIILVVLCSPILRQRSRNLIIVSIAVADLLLGSFITPMAAATFLGNPTEDCNTNLAFQVIGDHGIFFVVGWELVTFNVLHIQESNSRFSLARFQLPVWKWVKNITVATWPWLVALCMLLPLVITNMPVKIYTIADDAVCRIALPRSLLIIICFFSLYFPFYLCVSALVTSVICYSKGCHRDPPTALMGDVNANSPGEESAQTQEQSLACRENPLVVFIPNTVYLVSYMPFIVFTWLHFSEIYTPTSIYGMTIFGVLARSFILPISWLVFKDIRHDLKDFYSRLKRTFLLCISNPPTSTSSSVSFSRLRESHTV